MPQQRVYYEYVNGNLVPYWYVLTFEKKELDWDNKIHYYELIAPFEKFERDEFDDSIISISILVADFVVSNAYPGQLGINLSRLKERITRLELDVDIVQQFIIQMPDIEEVSSLWPNHRKKQFLLKR
ncbi:hypothetical protein [Sutcliffiella horikoshii]|uniref:hypothetical protein n=1 Tax=Sutcliffiella horikoshii TaxID=79883 RepID=UPI003CFA5B6C